MARPVGRGTEPGDHGPQTIGRVASNSASENRLARGSAYRQLGRVTRRVDCELKSLRDAVAAHPALQFVPEESQTIGGFGRNDRFSYHQIHGGPGGVANRVLLEAGAASGREPTANVELRSYLGQFLQGKRSLLAATSTRTI